MRSTAAAARVAARIARSHTRCIPTQHPCSLVHRHPHTTPLSPPNCNRRWPLSDLLQRRIRAHERNAGCACFFVQLFFGLCLPSGLLVGTEAFDYDRDVDVLRKEVAAVVAQRLPPGAWDLQESIDSEAAFGGGGKRLLALYLT